MYNNRTQQAGGKNRFYQRRKVCRFCVDKDLNIDYKTPKALRQFITERGKIIPRRITGTCAKHQRQLTVAIKQSRQIALLPFVGRPMY
ncbi:MAG: 30S ribosomal protein S18 [Desulfobacula sp.]|jgi:small subunit ribosomal protein S18|uniref:30S ribosomal protein S18 n=1 Tax=Desulfobacula sp. TaxID=2593537 RepID=UPI001E1106E4|nr:30S ribosomal protein S18 [Desulfobacula sp.]MBT4200830.1 30S ribosomal protein S18 [Desulfobacula sp.]MBT4508315.1 30S ribosomal protein S18 [Desulfobacula sp.]MBT4875767.1 30S ribosomal protein S18 [Desulfobacula sp.]MBT5546824.1 30S ribosomal protein S18 [Desulfobacula sp.]